MSGLNNLLAHIEKETSLHTQELLTDAQEKVAKILEADRIEAIEKEQEIERKSEETCQLLLSRIEASTILEEKKILLETKQQLLNTIFEEAKKVIRALEVEAYFTQLLKIIEKHALPYVGKMVFSAEDKARIPAWFTEKVGERLSKIEGAQLELGEETAKITGGVILLYENVEEDCSLDKLFLTYREALQDKVAKLLFDK